MRDTEQDEPLDAHLNGTTYEVGYCKPPVHTRFKPGQSGNPSGRPKGSQNLKTMFEQILKETISLRDGNVTKKITKAEAILRSVVIGAMKGDARSQMTLFRLAEQVGQFEQIYEEEPRTVTMFIVDPAPPERNGRYPDNGKVDQ
jgi:hypothetical protein